MSNPLWPPTLPQNPYQDGPSIQPAPNALRTTMDVGPPKQRRRYTAVFTPVSFNLLLSEADIATLDTFVITTLQDVLQFDWIDFKTGGLGGTPSAATYRFVARPTYVWFAADVWQASIQLEKLP
jgi:hypothetical protein